jgi:DNA-directed RNA polymerase specialized sigma24 family protein
MADRQALLLLRRLHTLSELGSAREPADPTLLGRYLDSGDTTVLDALVRRHGAMVLRVARRVLANAHDVEDVFQATFLVLARRASSIRKGESLASFLHGVAYRLALKVRAMAARRQVIERCARARETADPLEEMTARELAAGTRDGTVVVWELPTGKEVARLKADKEGWEVRAVFSPDIKRLATVSRRGQVTFWDATALKEEWQLPHKEPGVMSLAFGPDSKRLAIGCSGMEGFKRGAGKAIDLVRLWDVVRGVEIRGFDGVGQLLVQSVQFSPDGQLLAAGNWDLSIELWDVLTGRLCWRSKRRTGGGHIAFSRTAACSPRPATPAPCACGR